MQHEYFMFKLSGICLRGRMGGLCSRPHDADVIAHDEHRVKRGGEEAHRHEKRDDLLDHSSSPKARPIPQFPLSAIREYWPAGGISHDSPPHYIPSRFGPFVHQEKVAPQSQWVGTFRCSSVTVPPRVANAEDDEERQRSQRGNDKGNEDTLPVLRFDASKSLFVRAYLPHSLTSIPVGWARPNANASFFVDGFHYRTSSASGKADTSVQVRGASPPSSLESKARDSQVSGHVEPLEDRKKVILFPSLIRAVALFLSVDGSPVVSQRSSAGSVQADGWWTQSTAQEDDEKLRQVAIRPVSGAFDTLIYTQPQKVGNEPMDLALASLVSIGSVRTENSVPFTISDFTCRTTERPKQQAIVSSSRTWAAMLLDLPEGDHEVSLELRCVYDARFLHAVYVKSGAAGRVTGRFDDDNELKAPPDPVNQVSMDETQKSAIPSSHATSDVLASSRVIVNVSSDAKHMLRDFLVATA